MKTHTTRFSRFFPLVVAVASIAGCAGRTSIFPNPDPALRLTAAQMAADAAKRHPYPADAPRGGEIAGRAQVGYMLDVLEVVNLSDADWENVDVWVNQKYVVHVPSMKRNDLKKLWFHMLFDDSGNSFPTNNKTVRVSKVEFFKDGKLYDVTTKLAD